MRRRPPLPPRPCDSTTPPSSSRQARAVATRGRILEAAAADFAENGYHGASLSRILERSPGVTKGALYFHFTSKEAMALAVVQHMSEDAVRLVERVDTEAPGLDPLRRAARLACGVQDLLSCSVITRAGVRLAIEGAAGPTWSAWPITFWESEFTALFVEARERGEVRSDIDLEAMGRFVLDISQGAFSSSMITTGLVDLARRVRHNWDLMFAYMAEPEWLAGWHADGAMSAVMARHLVETPTDVAAADERPAGGG